jgi:PAS domain S-box-containing protein
MEIDFTSVIDALPGLVWSARPDGRVEFLNRRWREYTGREQSAPFALEWLAAIHPEDLPDWMERWRADSAPDQPWERELRLRRFDGTYRWFLSRASPLTDASGRITGWCGINSDIDDRRRAETVLHAIEVSYSEFVRSFPGLIVTMDMSGRVELFSSEILEYFGKTAEDLQTWSTNDAVHPDDRPRVAVAFAESVATGKPYSIEHRCRRADGVYRWFRVRALAVRDDHSEITGWYVVLTDIDDLKRAEEAMQANGRNLTLIVNTIPALAWSATVDGRAEFFNQHYLDYIGLTAEQASGLGWTSTVHPDDLGNLVAAWQEMMHSGSGGEIETRLRRFDGEHRWFLLRTNPLRDESGRIVKWYGINTDIEERKRAEEALNKARTELAHVARITTLNALTASIAHEVNQPLSGIITNASTCIRMLDASPPNVDGARETAKRMLRDGNRAADVIARLRALFSKKEFSLDSLDLNEATREVIALSSSDLQRHRVILEVELADDLPRVTGDRIQLQQVVLNLLRNALDAMTELDDRPRHLLVKTERDGGDRVRVTVRDAGVGVDRGSIDKLFDAFYTTKSEGMGVGLSVSRSIIESHRGRIWATPNEDAGVTFAFSIPSGAKRMLDDVSMQSGGQLAR